MDACRDACRRSVTWCGKSPAGLLYSSEICGALLALVAATEAQASCSRTMALHHSLESFASEEFLTSVEGALGTTRSASQVAASSASAAINEARKAGIITEHKQMELESCVAAMASASGECECLGRTPTPLEYHVHCTRFLVIFCFSLPFNLAPTLGWSSILVCFLISYSLMGLDEIASVVETPFQGYLPIKALWAGLRSDVAAMLALENLPAVAPQADYQ